MKAVTDDNLAVDFVRLGAQPVDTGTRVKQALRQGFDRLNLPAQTCVY